MYRYFISFSHSTNGSVNFGNIEMELSKKITDMKLIQEISPEIEKYHGVTNVVVMNFILLPEQKEV